MMRGSLLWSWIVLVSTHQRHSFDYCNMEIFNVTCEEDHVIMMESARYGRMNIGRCMKAGYGHQGCSVDVLSFLDSKCSGRKSCRFQVPDVTLYEMQPCPPDFTSYLEATHSCVAVIQADPSSCQNLGHQKVKDIQSGFITSHLNLATNRNLNRGDLGRLSCHWLVEVMQGQRINISLHSILLYNYKVSQSKYRGSSAVMEEACFEVGFVVDGDGSKHLVSVCSSNERLIHVTLSQSHVIRIEFSNIDSLADIGIFIFEFKATGCPHIPPSPNSWHHKSGDTLVARCNNSIQSWHLICRGTEWVGEPGNCSNLQASEKFKSWSLEQIFNAEDSFPFGVLLAVSIGVAMGIVIGASLLCLITLYLKRQRHNSLPLDGYSHPKDHVESSPSPVQLTRIRECQFLPNHWTFHDNSLSKQAYVSPNFVGETRVGDELFIGEPTNQVLTQHFNQATTINHQSHHFLPKDNVAEAHLLEPKNHKQFLEKPSFT